jgi:CRP-like cAMP-binding protein
MDEAGIKKFYFDSPSFFEALSTADVAYVKSRSERREYKKGQQLFRENMHSKGIFIIRKGKVKIMRANAEGRESIMYIYKKGEFLGFRPLLANEPNAVTAQAMENVTVTFISRDIFNELLSRPAFSKKLLVSLAQEFTVWVNKITIFTQYHVKERVALSLLILARVYQAEGNEKTVISINRDDFASFVGTAKESLVRMLRIFKDEGIITAKGTQITLLKPRGLLPYLTGV